MTTTKKTTKNRFIAGGTAGLLTNPPYRYAIYRKL
ncbi:Uncharacterised protein [Mycolicibacterium aurum]|uniref:Uncharacterized protein n=1 Tax=Mycolicibacterium aurum TaxID=1791 RepID=A0A3S4VH46_MYCAU|nr:Uncharacterised protein [Mycolicibacterium aurum]